MAELMTSTLIGSLIQLSGKFRQMLASLTTPWPADMQNNASLLQTASLFMELHCVRGRRLKATCASNG